MSLSFEGLDLDPGLEQVDEVETGLQIRKMTKEQLFLGCTLTVRWPDWLEGRAELMDL